MSKAAANCPRYGYLFHDDFTSKCFLYFEQSVFVNMHLRNGYARILRTPTEHNNLSYLMTKFIFNLLIPKVRSSGGAVYFRATESLKEGDGTFFLQRRPGDTVRSRGDLQGKIMRRINDRQVDAHSNINHSAAADFRRWNYC